MTTDTSPRHRPHPVSRAEMARRLDRSRATVTRLARGPWAAAQLAGGRLDAAHPDLVADVYERWGIDAQQLLDRIPGSAAESPEPTEAPVPEATKPTPIDGPAEGILDMTFREITTRFGSEQGFDDWLSRRKTVAEIARLESRNQRDDGRLIPRAFVQTHVLGYVDGLQRRLLLDSPRTIAVQVSAGTRAGKTLEELIDLTKTLISREIRGTKRRAQDGIRGAQAGNNPPEPAERRSDVAADAAVAAYRTFARSAKLRLAGIAATTLFDHVWKAFARAAAGRFDEVMALRESIETETVRQIGNMLSAHIETLLAATHTEDSTDD